MNHAYIEEHSLIERYHQGRLPAEEEARFEEHFAGCAHCQQELQAAREFRLGLKSLAAQESARKALVQIGLLAWLSRRSLRVQAGLLLAALILLFVPWVWLLESNRQWNSRIEQARGAASDWRQRYESEQQSAAGLQERLEQLTASAAQPLINTPVFLLSALRSGSGQPAATVDLTQAGSHLVLAVDVGADPRIEGYRITISDSAGNRLWQESGLQPNALEAVMITFPAGFFSPGDYRLKTEGQRSGASAQELGNYSFQVVQAQ